MQNNLSNNEIEEILEDPHYAYLKFGYDLTIIEDVLRGYSDYDDVTINLILDNIQNCS